MKAIALRISAQIGKFLSAALAITFFCALATFAQSNAADLTGTVTDPNGAVVAGATVTARNPATGVTRTVTTNDEGVFQLLGLPPDDYEITAEAPTFKKTVISPVKLTIGQQADLRVQLEIGGQESFRCIMEVCLCVDHDCWLD